MNLKRIIALVLALLLGISGTTSNVFAADKPLFNSPEFSTRNGDNTTPTSFSEVEVELKEILKDILEGDIGAISSQNTPNYERVSAFENTLKLFAEQRKEEVPDSLYRKVVDNYCNTDFYAVDDEQKNFQHQIGNISSQVKLISDLVEDLGEKFWECKNNINDYRKKIESKNFTVDDIDGFYKNLNAMKDMGNLLSETYKDLCKFQEETKSLEEKKNFTYKNLYSKYSKKSKSIYSSICTMIDTQNKKYDLQINALLANISQNQKIIVSFTNKRIVNAIKENRSFISDNPFMKSLYKEKRESNKQQEYISFLESHIIIMQNIRDAEYKAVTTVQDVVHPAKFDNDYANNNISPISQNLDNSKTSNNANSRIKNRSLIDKEISQIFKDNEFARFVYEDILNHKDFKSNYKLDYFDVYMIENSTYLKLFDRKKNINSLKGIEYFIGLRSIYWQIDSSLTSVPEDGSLDSSPTNVSKGCSLDLSSNSKLESINCINCRIDKIKFPETETIETINLSSNNLSGELDLSSFKNLKKVNLDFNNLTGLTIANENNITELNIVSNEGLKNFNFDILSNLKVLNCSNTSRESLLINNLKDLEELIFKDNKELKKVDISNCTKLKKLDFSNCSIEEIDLSSLTSLEFVNCSHNQIKELKIPSDKLKDIKYINNPLTEVSFSEVAFNEGIDYDDRFTGKDRNGTAQKFLLIKEKSNNTATEK